MCCILFGVIKRLPNSRLRGSMINLEYQQFLGVSLKLNSTDFFSAILLVALLQYRPAVPYGRTDRLWKLHL